ncbi:cation:proton antiporter [Halorussus salinisoli]|uniref:cation:proton antiporter n=1 Tax=Halorussus salinisoli TaxID=2558242 RepID=UPI0010C1A24A|nr:cation:proton antiporter [Halorussus salinisoli]
MVETTAVVLGVLVSFAIAIGVRVLANRTLLPYTVLLVTVGFMLSVFPLQTYLGFNLDPLFTHDAILFIFLPAIVFLGAAEIDHERFRQNFLITVITVLVGLPVAITAIGWLGTKLFEMPLLIMLLFGAMAYPIDPVAVLSLFEEAGVPPRLAVLVEGESLLDDGLAIVVFSALLALVRDASPTELTGTGLFSLDQVGAFVIDFLIVSLGGTLVGIGIGYATYRMQRATNDQANLFMISFMAVYGGFYVAEHVLHVSGILATVVTGLILGTLSRKYALTEENLEFLVGIWESIVFLLETMLFVAIGIEVSSRQVLSTLPIVLTTLVLLIGVRAGVIYGIMNLLNQVIEDPVPVSYQHVIIWGGMHGVIPIALALSLGPAIPFGGQLRTAVFGVVVASMILQGLSITSVLEATGVT